MHLRTAFCLLLAAFHVSAQTPPPAVPAAAQRYLDILIKRLQPGTIYERFYAAWLEESTPAELGVFLTAKTAASTATAADHLLLALFQSHRGDDPAALTAYEAALKLDPGNVAAWIERSRLEARALDFATALKSLDEAAKAKPEGLLLIEIGKLRGRALLRLGKNEEALRTWKELSAAHADDEDLAEEMADLLTDEGQYDAALEAAQALIKRSRDPVARTLHQLRLTDILLLAERRDDALKNLRAALATTGSDSWIEGDVLDRMSRVFRMSDDVSGLEKFLAELVKEHPQRVALAWQHTQLLGETGQKDAALKQARALLQSNPGRRDLQEGFLALLESLELIQEAVEQARVLVQLNAGDKEMRVRLATLLHRAKDDAGAQTTLEQFLAMPGTVEADHVRVARLLESWEEQPAKPQSPAALAYARLVEKFPDSISAQEAQAHYLHRVGQREAALAIWTRLAKSAALEDLLRIAQALQARLETRTALDLLIPRERDFATEARYYALLVQLGIASKELERALPWARARLKLAKDAEAIEAAIKDLLIVLRGEESAKLHAGVLEELQKAAALTIQDRCLLAALLEDGGKSAEAEKALSDAPEADRLIALSQLAQLWQTRQEWEKAAQTLQQVIALPDARTTARVQRIVDFYRRAGKPEEALKWIAEWKKLSPSAVQPWQDESRLLLELGRPKDALTLLRGAIRKFPDSIETASSYATLCLENGQPDEAERTYLALYEKTTDAAARLRLLGPLALAAQQHNGLPRLIENFQQRQKQNRASAQPWLALAEIQRSTGNDEERRRCLYEASRLRPQDISLLLEIARSEEEVGLTAEALRTLEAAAKLDKTTKTREHIARLQIDSGDADAGYRMLFELAGGSQMDARGIEQMADTIAEKGEWERVISFLEPLLPKHPKDYRLHYLNAIALEEAGRERDAVRAFLALLDLHEELPGVLSTGRSIGLRQQYASRHLPPGVEDWLVLPGMMQFSYAHRQKAGQRSRGGYGGYYGQQISNGLPRGFIEHAPGVAESPVLALVHLLQIAGGWDEQERAALVPQLSQAGVSDAALLLEAAQESPQLIITPEMLAAHPQNATLHAVWLMQYQQGEPEELLPVYENAWKLFQTTEPSLAHDIALRAWSTSGEKPGAWLQRMMDLIKAMPKADEGTFRGITSMLQSPHAVMETGTAVPRLKPEEITWFSNRLLEWYRAKTPTDGYHASAILSALAVAQDWPGMVEVMRLVLAASQDKSATAAQQPAIYTNHQRSGYGGWRLTLQPQQLYLVPGLPMDLAGFTSQLQGTSPYIEEMQEVPVVPDAVKERVKAMQDGLRPFIAKADSPSLKFILQLICGEEAALEQDLAARLQARDATADDFLTAGWLAQRKNDHAKAVEHLAQALQRTTDANARLSIENALLFHAQRFIQKEQDEAKITPVIAQAKALLDTHLQKAKSDDEKYQIAQLMSGIGLAEEAQALQEAVQAARNSLSTPARQRSTIVANPYSSNRAYQQRQQAQKTPEQLVREGKTELAVKESTRQLRAAIQQTLSPQNGTGGHQQLHQVMNEAMKLKLWDDVAKGLRDGAEGGWRSRLEYAVMLEHIGNDSVPAQAEHRAVIAANARAYDAHMRLAVVLSYEGKYEEAARHWRALPAMQQEVMLPGIVQEFTQRHEFAVPRPDALSGLLCAWLKGLEPNRPLSMNLVQQFNQTLQYLQQADSGASLSYPSLYEPWRGDFLTEERRRWKLKADGSLDLDEASAKDRATRRKAHDDLCRAMLEVPELAQTAFPPLAGLALDDGDAKAIAELETTAQDLLTRLTMPKLKRRLTSYGHNNIYNTNNPILFSNRNQIFMPDAALFLVRAAALRQDTRTLDETLYPLITRVHGKPRAAFLKGYADLLMAKDDGFIAAAESWLKQQHPYSINNEGGARDEVLRLWLDRKITEQLDALYTPKSSSTYGYNIPHAVTAYVMALGQRDANSMRQFVRKLRDQWLGTDAEARRKAVSAWITLQNDQRRRSGYYHRQPGMKEQAVNAYIQWLQQVLQKPRGLALLEIALEDGLGTSPDWLRQIAYQHTNSERLSTPEGFLFIAEAAGFLADAARFRPYDVTESIERHTWLGSMTRQFRENRNDEQLNATLEQLGKRPPTFGTHFVQALLVKNSRTQMWLDGKAVPFEAAQIARFQSSNDESQRYRGAALELVLTRHAKDLTAISAAGQQELSTLLRQELRGYPQAEQIGEALTTILAPLLKIENAELFRKVDQVLAAKTWKDVEHKKYQLTRQFPALLRDMARLDLPKAEAAARHAVELLRTSPEHKQAVLQKNNRETPDRRFLQDLGKTPQLINITLTIAAEAGLTNSRNWAANLCYPLEEALRDTSQAAALFTGTPWVAEASAFRDLETAEVDEPTLLARLIDQLESQSQAEVAQVVRGHLSKQPATFGTELILAFLHRGADDQYGVRSFYNTKRPDDSALLAFIRKRSADFSQLPPGSAATLFTLLQARLPDLPQKMAADAELKTSLQPLAEANARQFESDISRWLTASALSDLEIGTDEAVQSGLRLLDRLAQTDKARAVTLLDHISKLLAQEEARNSGGQRPPPHETQVARWLQSAAAVPELFGEIVQRAEESGAAREPDWMSRTLGAAKNLYKHRGKPQRLIALLEGSDMLAPAASFNPHPVPTDEQQRSMLEQMSREFASSTAYPGLVEELEKRQPRTFGVDFILLFAKNRTKFTNEISAFAKNYADEISTCSAGQQKVLAAFFERQKWVHTIAPHVPALRDEFGPILQEQENQARAFVADLLKTQKWQDMDALFLKTVAPDDHRRAEYEGRMRFGFYPPGESHPSVEYLKTQLVSIATTAPDLAQQGVRHVFKIYQAEFSQITDPYRKPPLDSLLVALCSSPRLAPEVLQFAAQSRRTAISYSRNHWTESSLINSLFPSATLATAEKIFATLHDSNLLADAAAYDAVLLPGFTTRSMLGLTLWRLTQLDPEVRSRLTMLLAEAKDAKFGHRLLAASITDNDSPDKMRLLDLCAADFARLRPEAAGAVLSAFEGQFPELQQAEKAEGEIQRFAPLLQLRDAEERAYLDALLAGKRDAPQPFRGYASVMKIELTRLMKSGKQDEAMKLLSGLRDQIETPENTNLGPRHDERLSSFLRTTQTISHADSPALFACQMRAGASLPGVRIISGVRHPQGSSGEMSVLFPLWEQRGGWAAPRKVFGKFMEEAAEHRIDGTTGLWLPLLHDMLVSLGVLERRELAEWAQKQTQPTLRPVAHELKIALALVEATEPMFGDPLGARRLISTPATKAFTAAGKEASAMLRDEKIAPHIRLALAAYLVGIHPGLLEEETVQTWALAAAQAWHDDQPITRFDLEGLLNAASVLPMTETWQRTCALVIKRWNQREEIFRQTKVRTIESGYLPFILRFACRSGDEATLASILKNYRTYGLSLINGILLENGDWKHAATLKRSALSNESSHFIKRNGWLPPDEAALKSMRAESGEDALLAEVMALAADDNNTRLLNPKAQWPEHDARLAAFAKKLAATPLPTQAWQRAQTLVILGLEHPMAALPLLPQYEAVSRLFLSDSLGEEESDHRIWTDFLAVHAALKIAQKDFSQADASFKRLQTDAKIINRYGSPASSMEGWFRSTLLQCLARLWAAGLAREPEKLLKLAVLLPFASRSSEYGQISITTSLSCLQAWKSALKQEPLPAKPPEKPESINNSTHLVACLAAIAGSGKSRLSFQQRLALFVRISGQTNLASYEPRIWLVLTQHRFFTVDELIKNSAAIMEYTSFLAPAHLENYALFARQHGAFETAAAMFSKAAERWSAMENSPPHFHPDRCLAKRAAVLIRLKDFTEARRCLDQMNPQRADASTAAMHQALMKMTAE